jgi:thymidylate kinase
MIKLGRLIVFEGPDDVGKTTLAKLVVNLMNERGEKTTYDSFPGHQPGTLGRLVYDVHHGTVPLIFRPAPAALQMMHVAAHIDAIEERIVPLINAGTSVVLDRFWWSTPIYGWASNVSTHFLEELIKLEKMYWGDLQPTRLFCLLSDQPRPSYAGDIELWRRTLNGYRVMCDAQHNDPSLRLISNNGSLESALIEIMRQL